MDLLGGVMALFFACLMSIFILLAVYLIMIKLFISMLQATGLSHKVARFQVLSCFSAIGYSTRESELIMSNATRRKIITATMITGYIFSIIITSLLIGIILNLNFEDHDNWLKYFGRLGWGLGISFAILIIVIILTRIKKLRKIFYRIIKGLIYKNYLLERNDITYNDIIGDKYLATVKIFYVPNELLNKTIEECEFKARGIDILSVEVKNRVFTENFDKIPITKGIILEVYGKVSVIDLLFLNDMKS